MRRVLILTIAVVLLVLVAAGSAGGYQVRVLVAVRAVHM